MKKSPLPTGELALIEQIRRDSAENLGKAVALGIGDDCAILHPPPGSEVLVTTDFTLEGRHFRRDLHSPESVGHRCLARGLSDLAAMGATPLAAFLSLALPPSLLATSSGRQWIARFFTGLHALAKIHAVPLAGGDTSESPRESANHEGLILADIVLIGSAPRGKALRRSGAHPGDILYVTGHIGGSSAEFNAMQQRKIRTGKSSKTESHPHLFPEPRIAIGKALLKRSLATACIDTSDGLSTDLAHLCRASNVQAIIEQVALPIHPLAQKLPTTEALNAALNGGEDYELLFAARPSTRVPSSIAGVSITRIGSLTRKRPTQPLMTLIQPNGIQTELEPKGWEHFSQADRTKHSSRK
jgi:thiamine-monophosphate kinase